MKKLNYEQKSVVFEDCISQIKISLWGYITKLTDIIDEARAAYGNRDCINLAYVAEDSLFQTLDIDTSFMNNPQYKNCIDECYSEFAYTKKWVKDNLLLLTEEMYGYKDLIEAYEKEYADNIDWLYNNINLVMHKDRKCKELWSLGRIIQEKVGRNPLQLKEFFDKCSDIEKVKYYMGFVSLCAFISYFHIGDCMEEIREDSGFKKYTMVLGHENL